MKYILTSQEFSGEIFFKYNLKGYLSEVSFQDVKGLSRPVFDWIWNNLPTSVSKIEEYQKKAKNFKITEVPADLSFDRFWKEYGNKVGKKTMTENAWKKLSREDKVKALLYIPILRTKKTLDGTQMPYPSTYLNQRYFDV